MGGGGGDGVEDGEEDGGEDGGEDGWEDGVRRSKTCQHMCQQVPSVPKTFLTQSVHVPFGDIISVCEYNRTYICQRRLN